MCKKEKQTIHLINLLWSDMFEWLLNIVLVRAIVILICVRTFFVLVLVLYIDCFCHFFYSFLFFFNLHLTCVFASRWHWSDCSVVFNDINLTVTGAYTYTRSREQTTNPMEPQMLLILLLVFSTSLNSTIMCKMTHVWHLTCVFSVYMIGNLIKKVR